MRVTNLMSTTLQLNDIRREVAVLDQRHYELTTGKKIEFPSDDPIIASRALKYRSNLSMTEQFLRNTESGTAWGESSEAAIQNLNPIMEKIAALCIKGANDTFTLADKKAIVAEIRARCDQIAPEMNQTYTGRYLFSGFRTNEPPVLTEDDDNYYVITQVFDAKDIEKTISYQKPNPPAYDAPITHDINILKLAYKNVDFEYSISYINQYDSAVQVDFNLGIPNPNNPPNNYSIVAKSVSDEFAYAPPDDGDTINYIYETGELVFGNKIATAFKDGTTVTYEKDHLKKGELNPVVYFECSRLDGIKQSTAKTSDIALYVLDKPFESEAMHDILMGMSTNIVENNGFYFSGSSAPLASFDTNAMMEQYYQQNAAANGWTWANFNDFVAQMYDIDDPASPNYGVAGSYNISAANQQIFMDVLQGGLAMGFASTIPNPPAAGQMLLSATPTVGIGTTLAGVPASVNTAGKICIDFQFSTNPPQTFTGMSCGPCSNYSYGHGLLHMHGDQIILPPYGGGASVDTIESAVPYPLEDEYITQEMYYYSRIPVNRLTRNIYTDNMYADLNRLCEFVESLSISDKSALELKYMSPPYNFAGDALANAVKEQISDETRLIQAALYSRFNNMSGLTEQHKDNISKEYGTLGNQMNRIALYQERNETDKVSYRKMMSDNEDVDLSTSYVLFQQQQNAYAASLKCIAVIQQITLVDSVNR